jgi:hypothetical protein
VRSDSKEVCARHEVVGMSFARVDGGGGGQTETEVGAYESANRGRSPQGIAVAVAAVDEATGELLERHAFPQDRAGLRSLERWARRFPQRRPKRWRTPAASAESRWVSRTRGAGSPKTLPSSSSVTMASLWPP